MYIYSIHAKPAGYASAYLAYPVAPPLLHTTLTIVYHLVGDLELSRFTTQHCHGFLYVVKL